MCVVWTYICVMYKFLRMRDSCLNALQNIQVIYREVIGHF